VPGVDPKQVEITLDNGVLTLSSAAAQRALVLGRPAPVS
jgi:HSP20 family molecular chaperone IbpA